MNQIPNIEEVVEQFMMTWFRPAYFEALTPTNRQEQVIYDEAKLKWETCKQQLTETLHQQLQKARQDWLREEIVKLERVKVTKAELDKATYSNGSSVERPEIKQLMEWVNHRTLQTIIDRYHSELDHLLEEVAKDWNKQAENLMNGLPANDHLPDRPLNQERE